MNLSVTRPPWLGVILPSSGVRFSLREVMLYPPPTQGIGWDVSWSYTLQVQVQVQ